MLALVVAAFAFLPGLASGVPGSLRSGNYEAQTGTTNAIDIATGVPHFSWTNTTGAAVDKQRMLVYSSPDTNVVAHWRLDGTGTDASGSGRTLAITGAPSFAASRTSAFTTAPALNGSSQYLSRAADPAFDMANDFTVEAWFKRTSTAAGSQYIVEKGGGSGAGRRFQIGVIDDGSVESTITTAGGDQYLYAPGTARLGVWHHVALTLDAANTCTLYLDGTPRDTDTTCGPANDGVGDPLVIGRWGLSAGGFFGGQIDEVRISSVARSAAEIAGYYKTGLPFFTQLWDSDPSDVGVDMPSCSAAARCADIEYGATGTATGLVLDGARYYAKAKHRLGAAAWTAYSAYDWFQTSPPVDGTFVSTDRCDDPSALSLGVVTGGANTLTTGDCRIDFGGPGTVSLQLRQADGGGRALRRPTSGTLDASFGAGGTNTFNVGANFEYGEAALPLGDGSTVVAGASCGTATSSCQMLAYKLTPGGVLDTSFGGGDGHVEVDFPSGANDDRAYALAQQADGKLVLAGYTDIGASNVLALARVTRDGVLDTTFGAAGLVSDVNQREAYDVAITGEGRILVPARGAGNDSSLSRYLPSGSLDRSYGTSGVAVVSSSALANPEGGTRLHPLRTGKVLVLTWRDVGSGNKDLSVARVDANGVLDPTYGVAGVRTFPGDYTYDTLDSTDSAVAPDGSITVVSERTNGSDLDALVQRLTPSGALDTTFNGTGSRTFAVGTGDDYARGVDLDPAGRILVSGTRTQGTRNAWIKRLLPSGLDDPAFNGAAAIVLPQPSTGESLHQ
ncbi:MAG: uncharacterized protein JWM98_2905, partial [Thermoleophilia bacterium]|nr:uncharacterized protein [Thermoleophilia bacterium]